MDATPSDSDLLSKINGAAPPSGAPASSGNNLLSLLGASGAGASGASSSAGGPGAIASGDPAAGLNAFSGALVPVPPGGFKPFQ